MEEKLKSKNDNPSFNRDTILWSYLSSDLMQLNAPDHSIKPQYKRIIVPRFEVDWMKTQGEIGNLDTEE